MGLFSSRKSAEPSAAERAGTVAVDPVQAARAQARRRLIGAAVLLGVGVIGFPILFETQPRPVPIDLPIDIPRKDNAPSLPLPPPRVPSTGAVATPRVSSGVIADARRDAPVTTPAPAAKPADAAPSPAATPAPSPAPAATPPAPPKPTPNTAAAKPAPAPKPPVASAPADDGQRAKALLEGKPVEPKPPAAQVAEAKPAKPPTDSATATKSNGDDKADAAGGRFVVQVAAYSEAGSARDMRQRVEKLGLKSYTQVVEVDGAKRIRVRVGPFPARDDAEKAAATLKAAGLPASVLTL